MKNTVRVIKSTVALSLRFAKGSYFLFILATLLQAALAGPQLAFFSRKVLDASAEAAAGRMAFSDFAPAVVLFALCLLLPPMLDALRDNVIAPRYLTDVQLGVSRLINQKCMRMKYRYFEDPQSVDTVTLVEDKLEMIIRVVSVTLLSGCLMSLVNVAGLFWLLGPVAWWLPLAVLVPMVLFNLYFSKNNRESFARLSEQLQKKRMCDALLPYQTERAYMKELHIYGAFPFLRRLYVGRMRRYNAEYEKIFGRNLKTSGAAYLLLDLCKGLSCLYLLALCLKGALSVGSFAALCAYIAALELNLPFGTFGMWTFFYDKYDEFLRFEEREDGGLDTLDGPASLAFEHVSFAYPGTDRQILHDLSLTVAPGEKVALVGANGAGKSTLIKLLLGLYEPDGGRILLGGRPIAEYSQALRSRIFAPVFQDFVRYELSVRDNLTLGQADADDTGLLHAARLGGAGELAERIGLDQPLGRSFPGGVDLSGGEWQKLALSRAFVQGKPVLLLDEPTSQMDPMAESQLYEYLQSAFSDKTVLFVSHRLASARTMEKIVVLSDGVAAEQGTHDELMAQGGLYAEMFRAQRDSFEGGAIHAEG